jgi:hypothetical protein
VPIAAVPAPQGQIVVCDCPIHEFVCPGELADEVVPGPDPDGGTAGVVLPGPVFEVGQKRAYLLVSHRLGRLR